MTNKHNDVSSKSKSKNKNNNNGKANSKSRGNGLNHAYRTCSFARLFAAHCGYIHTAT